VELAVHWQPAVTVTPTLMLSADAGIDMPLLESEGSHCCAAVVAACVTENVRPATLMTPERSVVDGFGATVYWMVPFPVPDAPAVMLSQDTLLVAVQAQAIDPVTVTDALDPVAATVTDTGESVIAQP
jgi:hypothetical protein